jgi:hypothetical protein
MSTHPNYELLKQAYAIIDSIPETAIAFGKPQTKHGATPAGGAVCSPEGWLGLHSAFNKLGLTVSADGNELFLNGKPVSGTSPALIMARIFGLPPDQAAQLFGERDVFTGGDDSGLSDKRLWQRRMRDYLQQQGEFSEPPESGMAPKRR